MDSEDTASVDRGAVAGEYTWYDFLTEYESNGHAQSLYEHVDNWTDSEGASQEDVGTPTSADWAAADLDPAEYLGFEPATLPRRFSVGEELASVIDGAVTTAANGDGDDGIDAADLAAQFDDESHGGSVVGAAVGDGDVLEDLEAAVEAAGAVRTAVPEAVAPRPADAPATTNVAGEGDETTVFGRTIEDTSASERLEAARDRGAKLAEIVDKRTVSVNEELDEDRFFSTQDGYTTLVNRYDLEHAVPLRKKPHFREVERYWVNEPFAFVVIFHSEKENEKKYYMVEPHLNEIERDLKEFLSRKLRMAIKYSDEDISVEGSEADRRQVIERETERLMRRYDLRDMGSEGKLDKLMRRAGLREEKGPRGPPEGIEARPEPAVLNDDPETLTEYQVEKILYELKRDFIGYSKIDGIKHDINVEDVSCDGYNTRVFVYHTSYESIITNISHGKQTLDDFVVKLAQRSGKGISKRQPQVDATLPDGSRAQLTLGNEVSDHGTNYTIRQFKDIPFTPVDLINWNTFALDQMAFLWLCIENNKSILFAGGTASGKTTTLNACSLFIPSKAKIVSIEDTREVKLPQRNWVASVTRPSFADDDSGDIDEFDLLEAALRQRPEYIVFGEVRGEEGRTLFQVMSTGHTTYTTFHADSVAEVLRRFTTDPINVSKTMFTALDLVGIQTQTRVDGHKVRRNRNLTEINHYDAENDEINVQDLYQWQAETDEYLKMGSSNTLQELRFDRGWSQQEIDDEMFRRRVVLAYLIREGLNDYAQVAATLQAYMTDPETTMALIATDQLEAGLDDLREMESVDISIDASQEAMFPRPEPSGDLEADIEDILEEAEGRVFDAYRDETQEDLEEALSSISGDDTVELTDDPGATGGEEADVMIEDGGTPEH
jgi:flagellar protein FlaI